MAALLKDHEDGAIFPNEAKRLFQTILFIDVDYKRRELHLPLYALQQWLFLFGIGPNKYGTQACGSI